MAEVAHESAGRSYSAGASRARRRRWLSWLPVLPFFVYVALFLLIPSVWLLIGAFQTETGSATLANVQALGNEQYLHAYLASIEISITTALCGTVCGFFVAYAAIKDGTPGWVRPLLSTFAGVAANFAGIPLAFAFVATLGTTGIVTAFLADHGLPLYQNGFTLYSFFGLALVYTYFQLPLMVLLTVPALSALKPEWREAAANLGASNAAYWRRIALPVLMPSLIAATMLLFANSLGAYATAYALAQGNINLLTIQIAFAVNGNVSIDPGIGNALAVGMIVVLLIAVTLYTAMLRRVSVWQAR